MTSPRLSHDYIMVDIYIKSTQWLNIKTVSKLTPLSNCVEMFPFRFVFFRVPVVCFCLYGPHQ